MKILFVMLHPGYMRYYHTVIRALAQRGHQIQLAFESPQKQARDHLHEKLAEEFPAVSIRNAPRHADPWTCLLRTASWGMDFLRYLTPMYRNAPRLRTRVEAAMPGELLEALVNVADKAGPAGVRLAGWCLRQLCRSVPPSREFCRFIRAFGPDVVLATPLITQGSLEGEFLKAARALGIPSAYCVASWDNLTSKGLVRGDPDRVILWNLRQKEEAVSLHRIDPARVVVTGAQNFDEWFERRPSRSREEFCARIGLRPDRPFILYLCSSNFMAPNEAPFVGSWLAAVRRSGGLLAGIGVLIRPYPEHAAPFQDFDLAPFYNVAIHPRGGGYPLEEEAKADFFDALYHSSCVVGVNTSAMIESAIVGRSVLAVLAEEFQESQEGTIHFHYLRRENGGFLRVASSLDEHLRHLQEALSGLDAEREAIRSFVQSFVRPLGVDRSCVPVVVEVLEQMAALKPRGRAAAIAWLPIRPVLWILARQAAKLWDSPAWKAQASEWKRAARHAEKVGGDPLKIWHELRNLHAPAVSSSAAESLP